MFFNKKYSIKYQTPIGFYEKKPLTFEEIIKCYHEYKYFDDRLTEYELFYDNTFHIITNGSDYTVLNEDMLKKTIITFCGIAPIIKMIDKYQDNYELYLKDIKKHPEIYYYVTTSIEMEYHFCNSLELHFLSCNPRYNRDLTHNISYIASELNLKLEKYKKIPEKTKEKTEEINSSR